MIVILAIVLFAALYAIKGGWIEQLKGMAIPINFLACFLFCLPFVSVWQAIIVSLAWLTIKMSMGEEAGAIGRIGHWWGKYKDMGMDRSDGVKKALQRGVFPAAMLALATGYPWFIIAGLLFVPIHFVAHDLTYRITKTDGWKYAEPVLGATFGLFFGLWVV